MAYNNFFCIGGPFYDKKVRYTFTEDGEAVLLEKKDEDKWYRENHYTAEEARAVIDNYFATSQRRVPGDHKLRVSLCLDNAKWDNLHVFIMDLDKIDGKIDDTSPFFCGAKRIADKVTRSKSGGYHMALGIDKEKARPIFETMNLLQGNGKGFVCSTGNKTLDGTNKVDFFCDTAHFIYEYEEWDSSVGLNDHTDELITLLKQYFIFQPKTSYNIDDWTDAQGIIDLEGLPADVMREKMNAGQRLVFDDLIGNPDKYDPDCKMKPWKKIGIDIYCVFGAELGGSVFLYWSKRGAEQYQPQSCASCWNWICSIGSDAKLYNGLWRTLTEEKKIDAELAEYNRSIVEAALNISEGEAAKLKENAELTMLPFKTLANIQMQKEKLFRGDVLEMVIRENIKVKANAIGEDDKKISKSYMIKWRGAEYTLEQFFAAAFPEYKKFAKLCRFNDDVRRISKSQRDRLQYEVLADRFGLVSVDKADETALSLFFGEHAEDGGKSFQRISQRLGWQDGLAKMVTFGAQIKVDDTAVPAAWAYTVERRGGCNVYTNVPMTWDRWLDGIERATQEVVCKASGATEKMAYMSVAYQNGVYLAVPGEVRTVLIQWVSDMLAGHGYRPAAQDFKTILCDGYQFEVLFENV